MQQPPEEDDLADTADVIDSDARSTLAKGTTVGRYVVLDVIGTGGMGVVYKAYDPGLERVIAVKLMRARGDTPEITQQLRDRLLREAQALARLSHPNVVAVFDVGLLGEDVFVAMEYVPGASLRAWIQERKRAPQQILAMFIAAGEGLFAAHSAGVVHRDFKPDNVIVGEDGRVRVLDFGIARAANTPSTFEAVSGGEPGKSDARTSDLATRPAQRRQTGSAPNASAPETVPPRSALLSTPLTEFGAVIGTPRYMSPEQRLGHSVDGRADQFSFCVALYEALYGELPFGNVRASELQERVLAGTLVEPPADAQVPRWLRQILLRGIAVDPSARYPDMHSLLGALRRDPRMLRRRWLLAAAVLGVVVVGASAARAMRRETERLCTGAERKLAGVWDETTRQQLHQSFSATGVLYAEDAWNSFARTIDDWTSGWVRMRTEACEATRLRGEQSDELLDLRMECLDRRLDDLRAQVNEYRHADAKIVSRAAQAARNLEGLDECADARALKEAVRPPSGKEARQQLKDVEQTVAHARALHTTGRFRDGVPVAEAAVAQARKLHYEPALADALYVLGTLEDAVSDYSSAAKSLEAAALAGEAGRHDAIVVRAWTRLIWVLADHASRNEEAQQRIAYAQAAIERIDVGRLHDVMTAELLSAESALDFRRGDYQASFDFSQRAHELFERWSGADSEGAIRAIADMADARMEQGRYAEALDLYARALTGREKSLGPNHPAVASVLNNQGIVFKCLRRYDDAIRTYRRALEIRRKTVGPDHPQFAATLFNLGELLALEGKYDDALTNDRQALAVLERADGPNHPDVAEALNGIGDVLRLQHRYDAALEAYRCALAIDENALGSGHPALAAPLLGIGQVLLAKELPSAVAPLERAVALRERNQGDPLDLGTARFELARGLVAARQRERADAMSKAARSDFEKAGPRATRELAELDEWLASIH